MVFHGLVVDQPFAVGLIEKLRVPIAADVDETDDLVIAQPLHRIVHPPLVQPQPVIVRLAVRPDANTIPVNADAGPLLQPDTDLHARADPGHGLALEIEGKQPNPHRAATQLPLAVPALLELAPVQGERNGFLAVATRFDADSRKWW